MSGGYFCLKKASKKRLSTRKNVVVSYNQWICWEMRKKLTHAKWQFRIISSSQKHQIFLTTCKIRTRIKLPRIPSIDFDKGINDSNMQVLLTLVQATNGQKWLHRVTSNSGTGQHWRKRKISRMKVHYKCMAIHFTVRASRLFHNHLNSRSELIIK